MIIFKKAHKNMNNFSNCSILKLCKYGHYLDVMEIFISDSFTKSEEIFYYKYLRPYIQHFYTKTDFL